MLSITSLQALCESLCQTYVESTDPDLWDISVEGQQTRLRYKEYIAEDIGDNGEEIADAWFTACETVVDHKMGLL